MNEAGNEYEVLINGVVSPSRSTNLTEALQRVRLVVEAGLTASIRPAAAADMKVERRPEGGTQKRDTLRPSHPAELRSRGVRNSLGPISLRHSSPPADLLCHTTGVFPAVSRDDAPKRTRRVTRDWHVA